MLIIYIIKPKHICLSLKLRLCSLFSVLKKVEELLNSINLL